MLWQIVFGILGGLCFLYYAVICLATRRWNSTFSRFWVLSGALFSLIACAVRSFLAQTVICALISVLFLVFSATEFLIIRQIFRKEQGHFRWMIVLGAHVQGTKVTDSLARRLDRVISYTHDDPDVRIIVSGGQGEGEAVSEAEAMKRYLTDRGIAKARIFMEDKSKTTQENLRFSLKYLTKQEQNEPVGIVSNNFHLYRACCYAKLEGLRNPEPVCASCQPALFINYMVREVFAVWKMWQKILTKRESMI